MQYANIALPVKTADRQETYTYRIPPALLADVQIGQRVYVSFYRRKLIGTVTNFRTTPPMIKGSIKEIAGLVEPLALFTQLDLEVAREVARQYGATIGQVLEQASPKPAKRIIKKSEFENISIKATGTARYYGLYQPILERHKSYLTLIKQALKARKRALVLFPTDELVLDFQQILQKQGIEVTIIPATSQTTEHYLAWLGARTGQSMVILGTRKTIFVPVPDLRLIIIDSPSLYGYKEEQFPYYQAVTIARIKAKIYGSHLVLGDIAPRLADWQAKQQKQLSLLPGSNQSQANIRLIDISNNRGLIAGVTLERMQAVLRDRGRVVIFYNRKGSGRFYHCLDCETAIYCPRCDNLLTVYEQGDKKILICSNCQYQMSPPYRCEVCQSYRLGSAGLGIDSLAKILREHLPEASDIYITTSQIFYQPVEKPFDLIVSLRTDQLLHGVAWDRDETAYLALAHLAERTKELIIQTGEPENRAIQAFIKGNLDGFYRQELEARKQFGYPPSQPIIRITKSDINEDKLKQQAEGLFDRYRSILPKTTEILPPSPIGSGKKRDKYRRQIIIKSPLTRTILDTLPADWQIDPEPTEL